jgi:DNA-directed RNA polymerase subunit RPC12/RpoP
MPGAISREDLIAQLAMKARVSKAQARVVLDGLVELALREAPNGFDIPGLCHIEVKECRSPMDRAMAPGQSPHSPAHRELLFRPLPEAQQALAHMTTAGPAPSTQMPSYQMPASSPPEPEPESPPGAESGYVDEEAVVPEVVEEPEPEPEDEPADVEDVQEEAVEEAAEMEPEEPIFITFDCPNCGQEIEASTDLADMNARCPSCKEPIHIPSMETIMHMVRMAGLQEETEDGTVGMPVADDAELAEAEAIEEEAGADETEAGDEAGGEEEPPQAGGDEEEDYEKGSTMRIEMPSSFDIPKPIHRTIVIKRRP